MIATDLIDQIILTAELKENAKLEKGLKGTKRVRILWIEKLEDANKAGTGESN